MSSKAKVLVTGCAGFIGYHLSKELLNNKSYEVYGLDNLNDYYDVDLKKDRLKDLKKNKKFNFFKIDIAHKDKIIKNFKTNKYNYIIHLAAQAGVRYSITNPQAYVDSNLLGFCNVIEGANIIKVKHFIFASTSSVYGASKKFPLKEFYNTDSPLSFYAATKKSNEVISHAYANIFKLPITGLRFFTVYGPYGRPDMALFKFTESIIKNKKIQLFNKGNHYRDFTYVDDIVSGIIGVIKKKPANKNVPFSIFNIGSNNPHYLKNFLSIIEKFLGNKAKVVYKGLHKGDVHKTHADISSLNKKTKYYPKTSLKKGIYNFIEWYKSYYLN